MPFPCLVLICVSNLESNTISNTKNFTSYFLFPEGGIPKLVRLASVPQLSVRIEAIAALANLAVNGNTFLLAVDAHLLSCSLFLSLTVTKTVYITSYLPLYLLIQMLTNWRSWNQGAWVRSYRWTDHDLNALQCNVKTDLR